MWNPLSLPLAALGVAASVPRAVGNLARAVDLLEEAVAQAAQLNANADAGMERMDALNAHAELVLDELAAAREVFAEAMVKVDRLSDQGDRVLAQIADAERFVATLTSGGDDLVEAARAATEEAAKARDAIDAARPSAEELAREARPMIEAATAAREQLRESQAVLEEANERVGRALEMAEPLDRMTTRAARIAGSLRRDSGDRD